MFILAVGLTQADTCGKDKYECEGLCVYRSEPCNGACYGSRYKCGNLCVYKSWSCECGGLTLDKDNHQYCCTQVGDTCSYDELDSDGDAKNPVCSTGQAVNKMKQLNDAVTFSGGRWTSNVQSSRNAYW